MNDRTSPHSVNQVNHSQRYPQDQQGTDQHRRQQNFRDQKFQPGVQHQSHPQFYQQIQKNNQTQISQRLPQNMNPLVNQKSQATEVPHTTPNIKNLFLSNRHLNDTSQSHQQVNRNLNFYQDQYQNNIDNQTERMNEQQQQYLEFQAYQDYQDDQNAQRINEKISQPVWAAYNFKNGVYIRPNSPTTRNQNKKTNNSVQSSQRNSRNITMLNPANNPNHRLNNTAASNFVSEEEKIDPSPTPMREYRRISAQLYCLPTEEEHPERDRNVPPPTVNLYSPQPELNQPEPNLVNAQHLSTYNSAPLMSPNLTELWNISHNLTAATTNTVGSTAIGSQLINITPSDIRSRLIFQRNDELQNLNFHRPPPPSPLKTEDQSELIDQTQTQIRFLNDSYLQQQLAQNNNELNSNASRHDQSIYQPNQNEGNHMSLNSSQYREGFEPQRTAQVRPFSQEQNDNSGEIFNMISSQMQTQQDNNHAKMKIQFMILIQQMEQEMLELRQQNLELQKVILQHSRVCPQFNQQLSILHQQVQAVQHQARQGPQLHSNLQQDMSQLSLNNSQSSRRQEEEKN